MYEFMYLRKRIFHLTHDTSSVEDDLVLPSLLGSHSLEVDGRFQRNISYRVVRLLYVLHRIFVGLDVAK